MFDNYSSVQKLVQELVKLLIADDEMSEKTVSVEMDDEESLLQFIDIAGSQVCHLSHVSKLIH